MTKYAKKSPKEMISWRSSHTGRANKIIESQSLLHGQDIVKATLLDHILELGLNQFEANEKTVAEVKASQGKPKAKRFNFKQALIDAGASEDHSALYMDVRKQKKAVNTEQAFNMFIGSLGNYTVKQAVEICATEQWRGFKPQWVERLEPEKKKRYSFFELAQGEHRASITVQQPAIASSIDKFAEAERQHRESQKLLNRD